ncbi:MAG: hypothetical protein KGI08_05855 [Thaumarchaeota archaeon]|nr:hypothetical protein [Nitrososphaerota archaeon]
MSGGTGAFPKGYLAPGFLTDILALSGVSSLPVNGTAVVYSHSFVLRRGVTFGWEVKMTSNGVVAVTIELEQANQPPATEGAQDDAFVIPQGKATTNGLFPTTVVAAANTHYMTAYAPVASILGRLKLTGTGSNDATTALALARVYEIKTI